MIRALIENKNQSSVSNSGVRNENYFCMNDPKKEDKVDEHCTETKGLENEYSNPCKNSTEAKFTDANDSFSKTISSETEICNQPIDVSVESISKETHKIQSIALAQSNIVLSNWSLAIVPNNSNITKIEKEKCHDWIVVVGRRTGMLDLWHSSLITNRVSENQVCTSSGRMYELEGPSDTISLIELGFSSSLTQAFESGFPWNWRELLISDLCQIRNIGICTIKETNLSKSKRTEKSEKISKVLSNVARGKKTSNLEPMSKKKNANGNQEEISTKNKVFKKSTSNDCSIDFVEDIIPSESIINQTERTRSGRKVSKPGQYWIASSFKDIGKKQEKSDTGELTETLVLKKRKWGSSIL